MSNEGYVAHIRAEARKCTRNARENLRSARYWCGVAKRSETEEQVTAAMLHVRWHVDNAHFWRRQARIDRLFARQLGGV